MCSAASDLLTNGSNVRVKREKKIRSTNVNWNSYEQISNIEIESRINFFVSTTLVRRGLK